MSEVPLWGPRGEFFLMGEVPVCMNAHASEPTCVQGFLEHKVRHAVGAYGRPMLMRLGPPYERCGTLCSSKP